MAKRLKHVSREAAAMALAQEKARRGKLRRRPRLVAPIKKRELTAAAAKRYLVRKGLIASIGQVQGAPSLTAVA